MDRRRFIQTTGGIATLGIVGVGSTSASSGTLTNAEVTGDGSIVATDDDFVIAGQDLTVDGSRGSPVISNDGYSGEIYDNELTVTNIDATTFGVLVEGGDVNVYDNTVDAVDDLTSQFLAIGFISGATGKVSNNEITGKHRVGVYANGSGTDVNISRNTIVGPGPTTTGWADNGVQVSGGAVATIRRNSVVDHWWDRNDFLSSGIILSSPGDDVKVRRNDVIDNDAGIPKIGSGDRQKIQHNNIEVTEADPGQNGVYHLGVYLSGTVNAAVTQNSIKAQDGDVGVQLLPGAENTKLIGNKIKGWKDPIFDAGDDTKLPDPFDPED